MRPFALCVLFALLFAGSAAADDRFHKVDRGQFQVKVVAYDGATNGRLKVRVKNTTKIASQFSARGLYFVPDGDPDKAPQRLGAVGPFEIATDKPAPEAARRDKVTIAPGATVELTLDVFCIDSHRASPSSSTAFTISKSRMPVSLAADIDVKAKKAAGKVGGYAAPAATSAIQSEVWATRDAKWIELAGEGDQEAGK